MLSGFLVKLKDHKIPVSIKEWLTLLEAMQKDVISPSIDEFYYLSRTALVKDEQNFDKFDRAFGEYFRGIESVAGVEFDVPLEWLLKQAELNLHRLLFGRKVQLGLLEQPFERHVELDSGDRLDSPEVFAEGAVELVEILLVLHQCRARQIVELVDRGRDDALLHRLQERQPLLDRSRDPVVLELDEESGEHGAKAAGLGALAH